MTDAETKTLTPPDPRRNAFRPDLAAKRLEGRVRADRYVEGAAGRIVRGAIPVRNSPDVSRPLETEALFGETLEIFEESNGWAWVQLARDGYVGYVPADALQRGALPPTHRVQALGTFVYNEPDIKTPPLMHLPMNAIVASVDDVDRFIELHDGGYVIARHVAPLDRTARDYAEIAERFVGAPYLWGGRTRIGIDCSGLVQTALQAAGLKAPRDSDMQQAEIGQVVPEPEFDNLERGDLVFWKGHVGVMLDGVMFVHANAHHMSVVVEPLPEAAARIAKTGGGGLTAIKRIGALCA